jgi:multiple sugar transport system ATP-binding protein
MSGGQRQRVAIGRAIVRDPKVFLFDEPLSNLDAKLRVQMRVELQKLHQKLNATMVYVTHDQTEAMTLGDRIVVLKDGDIMQIGSPMELYSRPMNKFVAGFIGSPPINFIPGMITRDQGLYFESEKGALKIDLDPVPNKALERYQDKSVILGVRPENINNRPENHSFMFQSDVVTLEQMGNEILIYSQVEGKQLVARFSPDARMEVNEKADFHIDLTKLHFFDPATEDIIR